MTPTNNTERLLQHLGRGGAWQYYWGGRTLNPIWFPAGTNPKPPHWDAVYFGVNPSSKRLSGKARGGLDNLAAVHCLFAEYDIKDGATIGAIHRLDPAPSVVVSSGGGWHCYWLFAEPVQLDNDNRQELADIQRRWVEHMGGDLGAKDLSRVLRVPGTLNRKYDPPRPVQIIKADFDRLYSLGKLSDLLPAVESVLRRTDLTESCRRLQTSTPADPTTAGAYWLDWGLRRFNETRRRNRSGYDLAEQLRDSGISQGQALGILLQYQAIVQDKGDHLYTRAEARATVKSAYAISPREPANIKVKL